MNVLVKYEVSEQPINVVVNDFCNHADYDIQVMIRDSWHPISSTHDTTEEELNVCNSCDEVWL